MAAVAQASTSLGRSAPPRSLVAACFLSNFDRFTIGPVLIAVASGLHVRLSATAAVASGYAVAYGLSQPVWGMLSDRFGRLPILRGALFAAALAGVVSALMPTLWPLIVIRTVTGGLFGAVIPASLTYIGDTIPVSRRQGALSDLMSALGVGTAIAMVFSGVVAHFAGWRPVFALPAAAAGVVAVLLRRLPEPPRPRPAASVRRHRPLLTVLRERWSYIVMVLALIEGGVLLGCMPFLPPALQAHGLSAARAGAVVGLYGVGILIFTRMVKRLTTRRPAWVLLAAGGVTMAVGYLLAAGRQTTPAIALTAVLLGAGWAFMHSTLQTWATTVAPEARGTGVAMFAAALFVGSAAGSALAGPLAQDGRYAVLFGAAALTMIPLTLLAVLTRRRYTPRG
ncbi:MAG TPA: MFS transporter [Streptosporangiaceae bacterium]|nr:MFS transporter [Streptosporangiaceae bacterium]